MQVSRSEVLAALDRATSRVQQEGLASNALAVEGLTDDPSVFAASDANGTWGLAVRTRHEPGHLPPVRLETLAAEYGVRYALDLGGSSESVRVSVLRCHTDDPSIRDLFVTFCVALLDALPMSPSEKHLAGEVDKWLSLFWRLEAPPRTSVVGLIGELTILDVAQDTAGWVRAWHSSPLDNIDFAFVQPLLEVEVKSTTSQERVHDLSIHQATGPDSRYFASLIVELRETGVTVGDVSREIADRLSGADELHLFWKNLIDTCGSGLDAFFKERFIREAARESLQFYPADGVPRPVVELPLPAGVSGLRFRSDFSSSTPVESTIILERKASP